MESYVVNINVPNDKCCIGDRIKSKYDKLYEKGLYEKGDNDGNPDIYRKLYKDILHNFPDDRQYVFLSSDSAIASSVMSAMTVKYRKTRKVGKEILYKSTLNVLYIDSYPDIQINIERNFKGFNSSVVSNAMSMFVPTYTKHDMDMDSNKITMFGLDQSHIDNTILSDTKISHYTLDLARKKGFVDVVKRIISRYGDEPVLIVVDMCVVRLKSSPSVYRRDDDLEKGMTREEYVLMLKELKNIPNIVGLCLTGYDFDAISDKACDEGNEKNSHDIKSKCDMMTTSLIRETVTQLSNLKEKSINVFTEDTYFLIFRYNDDDGYGWHVLRGASLMFREEYIREQLTSKDGDDSPTIAYHAINIPDDENPKKMVKKLIMLSKTTIREQQLKIYDQSINGDPMERILYNQDKVDMMFELVNTPEMYPEEKSSDD
jgi:hypothetical protein